MTIRIKGCPRCGGDQFSDVDPEDPGWRCVQCSHLTRISTVEQIIEPPKRRQWSPRDYSARSKWDKIDAEWLEVEFNQKGRSAEDLAQEMNVSPVTMTRALIERGYTTRNRGYRAPLARHVS